ncbi:MAG: GNAT family N-acetyltransferase [Clostridiaceae bacterium]|nr:GNAT family N-acetyltransferase [Clostridiaceae bacterium]
MFENRILKAGGLLLRELTEEDAGFIFELETRPESCQYEMGGIPDRDVVSESCRQFIEKAKRLPENGAIKFVICNQAGERIGTVSLQCNWEATGEWEIGYRLLREYWGAGYASEAVRKAITFAFDTLSVHKLMAFINSQNTRSVALAKRMGMVQEARLREGKLVGGIWNDELVFALLRSDLKLVNEKAKNEGSSST